MDEKCQPSPASAVSATARLSQAKAAETPSAFARAAPACASHGDRPGGHGEVQCQSAGTHPFGEDLLGGKVEDRQAKEPPGAGHEGDHDGQTCRANERKRQECSGYNECSGGGHAINPDPGAYLWRQAGKHDRACAECRIEHTQAGRAEPQLRPRIDRQQSQQPGACQRKNADTQEHLVNQMRIQRVAQSGPHSRGELLRRPGTILRLSPPASEHAEHRNERQRIQQEDECRARDRDDDPRRRRPDCAAGVHARAAKRDGLGELVSGNKFGLNGLPGRPIQCRTGPEHKGQSQQ
jgi:hypothetical protein